MVTRVTIGSHLTHRHCRVSWKAEITIQDVYSEILGPAPGTRKGKQGDWAEGEIAFCCIPDKDLSCPAQSVKAGTAP